MHNKDRALEYCRRPVNPDNDMEVLAEVLRCMAEDSGLPFETILESVGVLFRNIRSGKPLEESVALSIAYIEECQARLYTGGEAAPTDQQDGGGPVKKSKEDYHDK